MKASTIALGIAALIALSGCGDSAVSGPAPAPDQTPTDSTDPDTQPTENPDLTPTPAPDPTPEPTEPEPTQPTEPTEPTEPPAPTTGAGINMAAPFSQQIDCKYGIKPYYVTATSGVWTVAFDGDNLSLQSGNGQQQFGGSFANSGNPTEREDYSASALQRTYLGATGGELYFARSLTGAVIAAGHNNFGGSNPRADTVECGNDAEWVATPNEPSPFTGTTGSLSLAGGTVDMHCAVRASDAAFNAPVQTRVITGAGGSLEMLVGGRSNLFEVTNFNGTDRVVSNVVDSATLAPGGIRVYTSQGTDGSTIEVNLRHDNLVRHVRETRADGQLSNCVPYPLDPRF